MVKELDYHNLTSLNTKLLTVMFPIRAMDSPSEPRECISPVREGLTSEGIDFNHRLCLFRLSITDVSPGIRASSVCSCRIGASS